MKSVRFYEAFIKMWWCWTLPAKAFLWRTPEEVPCTGRIFNIDENGKNKLSQICAAGLDCEHWQTPSATSSCGGREFKKCTVYQWLLCASCCPRIECPTVISLTLLCGKEWQNFSLTEKTEFQIYQHFPPRWWRRHHQGASDSTHSPDFSSFSSLSPLKVEGAGMAGYTRCLSFIWLN